ncbi:MAG: hypothetical protein M1825_001322 [Sarcosagium campestre]|nr:MAG: hypothetical protein M1825_001322 [Sarcosagium campestre]
MAPKAKHSKKPSLRGSALAARNIGLPIPVKPRRVSLWDFHTRHLTPGSASHLHETEKDVEDTPKETETSPGIQMKIESNVIEWNGPDDPLHPWNWTRSKKWLITWVYALLSFTSMYASSTFSTAIKATAKLYGVSGEVTTLGTSLFVLGYVFGPLIFGPLSEIYGRKLPLLFGMFAFTLFQVPVVVAENVHTILICRFFAGVFGSAPLVIASGTLKDIWEPADRGMASCFFTAASFVGVLIGPVTGSFITQSDLGWRWTCWMTGLLGLFFWATGLFLVSESHHPLLLRRKAEELRLATKNWALHARIDESRTNYRILFQTHFLTPFQMLFLEPILLLITLYMSLTYGILYLLFTSYPLSYHDARGWATNGATLPLLSVVVGVLLGGTFIGVLTETRYAHKLHRYGSVVPEERLIVMIVGGALLPLSLVWYAWTSNPHIMWVPQVLSGVPFGFALLCVFLQGYNYIADVYADHAESALAANMAVRSLFGAAFPLFATQMYAALGTPWATTLLALLALVMTPIPILLLIYGKRVRGFSKYGRC